MVANAALRQQVTDSRTVALRTRQRRSVRLRGRLRLGFLEHRNEVAADQPTGALLLRRLIRQPSHATRQPARRDQMPLLSVARGARRGRRFVEQ